MTSVQVLPNSAASSRKQGHLEAGKRRLEEFRKKKAEERAKKAASTGQLQLSDVSQHEEFPKESSSRKLFDSDEATTERDGIAGTQPSWPLTTQDSNKINASQSIQPNSLHVTSAGAPALSNNSNTFYDGPVEKSSTYHEPNWSDGSSFPGSEYGYYNRWREEMNTELSSFSGTEREPTNGDRPVALDTVHTYPNIDENIHQSSYSLHEAHSAEKGNLSQVYPVKDPGTTNISLTSSLLDKSSSVSLQSKTAFADASTSHTTSTSYDGKKYSTSSTTNLTEPAPKVEQYVDGNMDLSNDSVFNVGGKKLRDDHYPNVDSASWQTSESFSSGYSLKVKSSSDQSPLHSTISEVGIRRSRPSFLDSLNVHRVSSVSHLASTDLDKSEQSMPLRGLKVHNAEIFATSTSQPSFTEPDIMEPLAKLKTPNHLSVDLHSINASFSINNDDLLRQSERKHEFPSLKKDDDFAALEQHIEDLTQEKFSLQRALEASRALAESLAAENSSLTDSFNQQGSFVNQLKSDMEKLYKEIRDQLSALESVKMEYANAQLECNAADERAKILASEVIGLEEKALRLRSSELKLERELENSNAEINSYKRKVSSLEKDRRDLQSTISALQEEKKLLQSKLRKSSANGKAIDIGKSSATTKNVSTSTEDLGVEVLDPVDLKASVEDGAIPNTANTVASESSAHLSSNTTSFPLPQDSGHFHLSDASGSIPPDQLRTIGNINSLISELALEKEELVRTLAVESSNSSKLKDLNKELSQKLEAQTQRLELLTAQHMANENILTRPTDSNSMHDSTQYADEGDEVVERVLGWIMKLFPGRPTKRRTSKLL